MVLRHHRRRGEGRRRVAARETLVIRAVGAKLVGHPFEGLADRDRRKQRIADAVGASVALAQKTKADERPGSRPGEETVYRLGGRACGARGEGKESGTAHAGIVPVVSCPLMDRPDEATMAWVEATLGPVRILSHFSHDHGYSRLWRLESGMGRVWLKMHAHPHKWAGEVHALTRWTPSLGGTPTLLGSRTDPEAALLTEVAGEDAEPPRLDSVVEARLWREAGAWLKRLHERENDWFGNVTSDGSPHGPPAADAESHLGTQWETRLVDARRSGLLDAAEIDFTEGAMRAGLALFAGERARAIHRDYTPRNWLMSEEGRLSAVIDFEHARWDVRAADLQRPWSREFLRNPALVEAFFDGYGGLPEKLRAQIETMRIVMALTTIVWATGVGDLQFAQEGRDALHRHMGQG